MKKNIILILIILSLLLTSFSGCLEKSNSTEKNSDLTNNLPPVGKIIATDQAFFEELVKFDASGSYDSDGQIMSYSWDFGDGEKLEGITVSHSYKFDNNFDIKYPIIYPVTLLVEDNDETMIATVQQIKIFPESYTFYLSPGKLFYIKPSVGKEKIDTLSYELEKPITIQKCKFNVTLYLEKPLFTTIKKLSLILYDSKGNEITKKDERFGINFIWKDKMIQLNGEIGSEVEFKSIKIDVQDFSFLTKPSMLYGGEKASFIYFNFVQI